MRLSKKPEIIKSNLGKSQNDETKGIKPMQITVFNDSQILSKSGNVSLIQSPTGKSGSTNLVNQSSAYNVMKEKRISYFFKEEGNMDMGIKQEGNNTHTLDPQLNPDDQINPQRIDPEIVEKKEGTLPLTKEFMSKIPETVLPGPKKQMKRDLLKN